MKKNTNRKSEDIKRFNPTAESGLDSASVSYMQSIGKVNIAKSPTNKSYTKIILGNIFTFFNILMFAIAGLLLFLVGPKVVTNLMFLLIIVCNLLIGTIQECKSKHTIEKLKLLNDSKIKARRDGKEVELLPTEIVLDDVVILTAGDQIPADCVVLEDQILEVNESLLTGESIPVKKTKGDMVFAGSFVVAGSLAVRVDKVGNDTYIGRSDNILNEQLHISEFELQVYFDTEELTELDKFLSEWFYGMRTWGLLCGQTNEQFCDRHAHEAKKELVNLINTNCDLQKLPREI